MPTAADIILLPDVQALIHRALAEDIRTGDATSRALVPEDHRTRAVLLAKSRCVVAGITVAQAVFRALAPDTVVTLQRDDGQAAEAGTALLTVQGSTRAILAAERTALNFAQRMTGIATLTRCFVDLVKPYHTVILDTRKTTPTLRVLEKYAVTCGGGVNHRHGLYDMILIKDNHRRIWTADNGAHLADAVRAARQAYPGLPIEIEVESVTELADALQGRPDWILLDNMPPDELRQCVAVTGRRCRTEASGGISLANVETVAATGVDAISLGCLTHSAPATDLSLEVEL